VVSADRPAASTDAGAGDDNPTPAEPSVVMDFDATMPRPLDDGLIPYWVERNLANEVNLANGPANVVFLGDSITDFLQTGAGQVVWETSFAPLGAINMGVVGVTTSEVLWQVETGQVARASPGVVVLMVGTNNLTLGQGPLATAAGIAKIVGEIQEQLPSTQILLLGVLPRGKEPANPYRLSVALVNDLIATLDDGKTVRFLDLGPDFQESNGKIPSSLMPDQVHPSSIGYLLYSQSVLPAIEGMLPPKKAPATKPLPGPPTPR
jgi:lysophospholipase L1-like esterase